MLAVIALCSLGLFGISPPASFMPKPAVVVYPFAVSGGVLDATTNAQFVTIIANGIAQGGDITVVPAKPGIERAQYLQEARVAGAAYYVTGFMSPLGAGVSLIEQVVSTQSGIVVFSNSAQISTFAEASSQAALLRSGILNHAGRNLRAFVTAPPPPAAKPAAKPDAVASPVAGATKAALAAPAAGGALFSRRKKGPAAAPSPSPVPSP